jgi:TIR domain
VSIRIFFCYAHEDEAFLNKIKAHLVPLQRQGLIDLWHDRDISAGTVWEQEINSHLETAQIILLLISSDFIASEYCYSIEMKLAIERHERGEARVIPVILRWVMWKQTPVGRLQALPKDGKPIMDRELYTQDYALCDVAEGVYKVVAELNSKFPNPLSAQLPEPEIGPDIQKDNPNIIDLSIEVARQIGADKHPICLADLHTAYLYANPGITKGIMRNSFDAAINYHCINMRSRFPDPRHKQKLASWLSRPLFKRVARARYMLLSPDEISLFHQRVKEGDPRVYEDEFVVDDLVITNLKN